MGRPPKNKEIETLRPTDAKIIALIESLQDAQESAGELVSGENGRAYLFALTNINRSLDNIMYMRPDLFPQPLKPTDPLK